MPHRIKPERQIKCLEFIRGYINAFEQSPTRTELGKHLGITKVSAHLLVDKLKRDGYVYTEPGHHRNIVLTKKGKKETHWGGDVEELRRNPWREAVDDMLVTCHEVASDDPRESINRLINWNVTVSLDPLVSSAAQELITRGREEALNESIKFFEELHERRKHMDNYALYFANLLRDRKKNGAS